MLNQQQWRNSIFGQFIKIPVDCERHPGEVANMVIAKQDVELRGLVCAICISPLEPSKTKSQLEPKSLKLTLLQIHQTCTALLSDVSTCAFVDHHVNLIRGLAHNHFKDIDSNLQAAITVYFQKLRELLNGKYFMEFYNCLAGLASSRVKGGDKREEVKWSQKMMGFIFGFQKLAHQYEEYPTMPLEERMGGVNFVKYVRSEVGETYKLFRDRIQSGKKGGSEEQILEIFNPYESSLKSFKFSTTLLNPDLKITDPKNLKMPNMPDNEYTLLALVQPCIGNKKRSLKLKMDGIKGWVAAGIAFRGAVQGFGYKFQQPTHGTVQMSYDGYSWGNDSSTNQVYTSWYFNEQDTLTVTVDPMKGELVFTRNEDANTQTLKFVKEKKDKIYFCVSVNYSGDEVTIID